MHAGSAVQQMAEVPFTQSELRALFQQHAGADGLVAASLLFQPRVCAPADQQDVRAWAGRASMSKKQRLDVDTFLSLVPEARASVGGAPVDLTPKITAEWMARLDAALPTREDFLDEGPALLGRGGALGGGLYLGSYAQAQDLELLCRCEHRADADATGASPQSSPGVLSVALRPGPGWACARSSTARRPIASRRAPSTTRPASSCSAPTPRTTRGACAAPAQLCPRGAPAPPCAPPPAAAVGAAGA